MQTLKERQVTSTILIPIFEKCLDYLQSWLNIDIKLVWYEEDDQFDLVVLSLRYGCPSGGNSLVGSWKDIMEH